MQSQPTTRVNVKDDGLSWRIAVILFYNLAFAAWLLVGPGSPELIALVANVAQFTGPLLALLLCRSGRLDAWIQSLRLRITPGKRSPLAGSLMISLGVLCFAIGQVIWAVYEQVLQQPLPLPSWADVGFLAAYPCILLGILLLPRQPMSAAQRTRVVLDGLMIMTATATLSWYFVLGPTVLAGEGSWLQKAIGAAYPLADLLLIGCLLLLTFRSIQVDGGRTFQLLAIAICCIIVTDTVFLLQTLAGTYATGAITDVGWPLGYMLGAAAARSAALMPVIEPQPTPAPAVVLDTPPTLERHEPGLRGALLPYLAVPAVATLLVYAVRSNRDIRLEVGVFLGGFLLLGLIFLRQIAVIIENARLYTALQSAYQVLERLATVDPLTDLPNHRAMVTALDTELARAQRWNEPFSLLFLDLDHFKALNDTYGHNMGDAALREFGRVAGRALRAADTLGRWGGEEFIVLLPHIDANDAREVGERIRTAVANESFTSSDIHMTCSVGVASYPAHARDRNSLVAAADQAMYAAKRSGRNQVCAAGDENVIALATHAATHGD